MTKRELYEKAYRLLNNVTPLETDCGALCNKACCDSNDVDAGMYLFPGEVVMYSQAPSWLRIEKSDFTYGNNKPVNIAICTDACERSLRPLACRIFPLTPYIESSGGMVIKVDPRSAVLCPLARKNAEQRLDTDFIDTVVRVFKFLAKDRDVRAYISALSELIDEEERFLHSFLNNKCGGK